jgi:hypothetical protein
MGTFFNNNLLSGFMDKNKGGESHMDKNALCTTILASNFGVSCFIIRVNELNSIIFPKANVTNIVSTWWLFV